MVRYLRLTNEHIRYVVICSLLQQSSNCVCAKYTLLLNDNKQESVILFWYKIQMWFVNICKSNLQVKINISAVRGSCRCPKNKDQKYFQALEALSKNVSLKFTSGNH